MSGFSLEGMYMDRKNVIISPIAEIHSDFDSKFGIPRQSGLVEELKAEIIFAPPFRNPDAVRGLEGFSHIWLIWQFSKAERQGNSLTVRPPRLGGNERMGVFATRSPFRPNSLGLSCVKLDRIEYGEKGPVLHVSGADLLNGTPIFDIKPYLPHSDLKADAVGGFAEPLADYALNVIFPEELKYGLEPQKLKALIGVLSQDPRPSYQNEPERLYGMSFAGFEIKFKVMEDTLTVISVEKN